MNGDDALHDRAKQTAFRLLSVRARSVKELRARLKEKGYHESVVERIVARLSELKYLDDISFARQWARNLAVNKLWGNRRIAASLQEKGIPGMLIEKVIPEVRSELTEEEAIRQLIRKKGKTAQSDGSDIKERWKLSRSLIARGFPPDLVFHMLQRSKEDAIDEGE
jgi:regulatory protein